MTVHLNSGRSYTIIRLNLGAKNVSECDTLTVALINSDKVKEFKIVEPKGTTSTTVTVQVHKNNSY